MWYSTAWWVIPLEEEESFTVSWLFFFKLFPIFNAISPYNFRLSSMTRGSTHFLHVSHMMSSDERSLGRGREWGSIYSSPCTWEAREKWRLLDIHYSHSEHIILYRIKNINELFCFVVALHLRCNHTESCVVDKKKVIFKTNCAGYVDNVTRTFL